jgi:hypothetical protein
MPLLFSTKLGTYIMAPEPMATAYFLNPSHESVCLYVYPLIVARQKLGKNVKAATNTHVTIEELLDTSFSLRSVSCQRNVDDQLLEFPVVYITQSHEFYLNFFKSEKNYHCVFLPSEVSNLAE